MATNKQPKDNVSVAAFEAKVIDLLRYIDHSAVADANIKARNRAMFLQTITILLFAFSFLAVPLLVFYEHLFSFIPDAIVDDLMWESNEPTLLGYVSSLCIFFMNTADILASLDRATHHLLIILCVAAFLVLTSTVANGTAYSQCMSTLQKRKMLRVRATVIQRISLTKYHYILDGILKTITRASKVKAMSTSEVLGVIALINRIYESEQPELFKKDKRQSIEHRPIQQVDVAEGIGRRARRCFVLCVTVSRRVVLEVVEAVPSWTGATENVVENKEE